MNSGKKNVKFRGVCELLRMMDGKGNENSHRGGGNCSLANWKLGF